MCRLCAVGRDGLRSGRHTGIEPCTRSGGWILRQSVESFRFRENLSNSGCCCIELFWLKPAQRSKPFSGEKALRLAYTLKRPADVPLKVRQQRRIRGIEAFSQNVARRIESCSLCAFEMLSDLIESSFYRFVVGRLGIGCVGFKLG